MSLLRIQFFTLVAHSNNAIRRQLPQTFPLCFQNNCKKCLFLLQNCSDFDSIANLYPYDSHHYTLNTIPCSSYKLRRGKIRYQKNWIIKKIFASIVSVFLVFRRTVGRIRKFISLKPSIPHSKSFLNISAN